MGGVDGDPAAVPLFDTPLETPDGTRVLVAQRSSSAPTGGEPFLRLTGPVVRGFGRGSKELGCPTANIPVEPYELLLSGMPTGVYYGYCVVQGAAHVEPDLRKMVMSCGYNPYYGNTKRTIEAHVLDLVCKDFYGCELTLYVVGYIRAERDFVSLEALKTAILADCVSARGALELDQQALEAVQVHWSATLSQPSNQSAWGPSEIRPSV
ncbi:Riboflavin kinase [Porphyridium purpureum]|uniref:riboflavin kinase n=1 Tax=Porphyridium purpureum TaxID=35688 RepID=A0A5J4YWX9_PORPP|nr:Riboflavin kinase [Porphyridium purpureum]|eukprot:POR9478..scf209_3